MSAHEVLGVPRDASPAVIRKAYLKLALTSHPDKGGSVEVGSPVSSVVSRGVARRCSAASRRPTSRSVPAGPRRAGRAAPDVRP